MFEAKSHEEIMRGIERRMILNTILHLDMKCFMLDTRVKNISRKWPGSTPSEQRRLRIGRMEVRDELEGLKIEFRKIERQAAEFDAGIVE